MSKLIEKHTANTGDKLRIMARMIADGKLYDKFDIHNCKQAQQVDQFKIIQDVNSYIHRKMST